MRDTVDSKCLQYLEPLFTHFAQNPTTIDEGTTSCTKTITCDADAMCIKFAFLDDEMGFAGLQFCWGLGEFGIGTELVPQAESVVVVDLTEAVEMKPSPVKGGINLDE